MCGLETEAIGGLARDKVDVVRTVPESPSVRAYPPIRLGQGIGSFRSSDPATPHPLPDVLEFELAPDPEHGGEGVALHEVT
jgi:hypothetical protein